MNQNMTKQTGLGDVSRSCQKETADLAKDNTNMQPLELHKICKTNGQDLPAFPIIFTREQEIQHDQDEKLLPMAPLHLCAGPKGSMHHTDGTYMYI